jgi:hypothetical protein
VTRRCRPDEPHLQQMSAIEVGCFASAASHHVMNNDNIDHAATYGVSMVPGFDRQPNQQSPVPNARVRPKHPAQNWVLDPVQDALFIIAAPLLCLGVALWMMQHYGAERGAGMIITAHIVLTVAHHMPTFIRIYGDLELFQRFKWQFILAPTIPLLFSVAVLLYINAKGYPVEYFLYLYIFLALWDPWHFLRQHFGFMRIYDRHNKAPVALASNMDWAICGLWFLHIMVASADWLPGLLEDLYRTANIPLLLFLPQGFIAVLNSVTWWLAVGMSLVYAGYLCWCVKRGYYISGAKIALLLCTFGVMYFTYTPNDWILQLVPAWSFKVGFATLGIVHMTQYLAIVWRYDRRLAEQGRARGNWFTWLHNRRTPVGIAVAAIAYVGLCILYGDTITTRHDSAWLMSCLLAIGFTSTLMHYYFDGFIWRVRHQQNSEALGLRERINAAPADNANPVGIADRFTVEQNNSIEQKNSMSWWQGATVTHPMKLLMRQLVYFGVPMGVLTIGAVSVWNTASQNYVAQMYKAQSLSQQGQMDAATNSARAAYASMQAQLPAAEKLAELNPRASNQAALAFLIYNESLYRNKIMLALDGNNPTVAQLKTHKDNVVRALHLLQQAVNQGGELGHAGRENLTPAEAQNILDSWRRQTQL